MERDQSASAGSDFFLWNSAPPAEKQEDSLRGDNIMGAVAWDVAWRGPRPPGFYGSPLPRPGGEEVGGTRGKGASNPLKRIGFDLILLDHFGLALR